MQGGSEFTEVSREVAAPALLAIVDHTLRELHAGAPGLPAVTLDSVLDRDLGLDSLARTELLLRTERAFGIRLPDDTLQRAETVGDLLRAAQHAVPALERVRIGRATGRPCAEPPRAGRPTRSRHR